MSWWLAGALLVLGAAFLYRWEHRMAFRPVRRRDRDRVEALREKMQAVELVTPHNVRLEGVVISPPRPHATLLYFGGREQDAVHTAMRLAQHCPLVRMVAFNYRGYGDSDGMPDQRRLESDALQIHAWVRRRYETPVLMGYSLGSYFAAYTAARREAAAVILVAPFGSAERMLPPKLRALSRLGRYRFDAFTHVRNIGAPLHMFTSADDEVVSLETSHKLRSKVLNLAQYKELSGYNHSELLFAPEVTDAIAKALES